MDNLLFSYYNPEREYFKNFIFRDSNNLFKFEGEFPNLKKIHLNEKENEHINITDYNTNICEKLRIKKINFTKCHNVLVQLIIELKNGKDLNLVLKEILNIIDSDKDFFDLSKDEINKMDLILVYNILKNLNFKTKKDFNIFYKNSINCIESVDEWFMRLSEENKKILIKIPIFINYLELLTQYLNFNPVILNENWTEFDEKLFRVKYLEEYLKKNYNKSSIYKEILFGYFENIDDYKVSSFLNYYSKKFVGNGSLYYETFRDYQIFNKFIDNNLGYLDVLEINIKYKNFVDNILNNYMKILIRFNNIDKLLIEKIEILIKYLLINPKNIKIKNISFYELVEQIKIFLSLKKNLYEEKNAFINKYHRYKFF